MEKSCQPLEVADFTLKGWISMDETHAFNPQHGFVKARLAPELPHAASPSLHEPTPRTSIGVCQAGRAVLTPQGLEASLSQPSRLLRVLLPLCASPLCAFPRLDLGKQEEGPHSPHWVSSCPPAASEKLQCPRSTLHLAGNTFSPGAWALHTAMALAAGQHSPVSRSAQGLSSQSLGCKAAVPKGCGTGVSLHPVLVPPSPISPHLVAIIPPIPHFGAPISFPPHHPSSRLSGVTVSHWQASHPQVPAGWWGVMPQHPFPSAIQICGAGGFPPCGQVQ